MMKDKQQLEIHPRLPSGEWEGFYCYNNAPSKYDMKIALVFSNSIISGSGIDDVAPFTWKGKYYIDTLKVEMVKHYATHIVRYRGDIDENGIWGTWEIPHDFSMLPQHLVESLQESIKHEISGGFHIWPKKRKANANHNRLEEQVELTLF